jgi:hypothetical protein
LPCHTIRNRPNVSLDWRSRGIGIVVRGSCNRFMPPHCAVSVLAVLDGAKPAFRRYAAANLCWFGFRAGTLVDESVILEIKEMPALLPAHDMPLQT